MSNSCGQRLRAILVRSRNLLYCYAYLYVVAPLDELHLVGEDDVEEDVAQVRLGAHHHLSLAVVAGNGLRGETTFSLISGLYRESQ